jgi:hypothetical protein
MRDQQLELRKRGVTRIDELERKALVEITRLSVVAQTEVISHGMAGATVVAVWLHASRYGSMKQSITSMSISPLAVS